MKIALVHDYLTQRGGAERVFELLCKYFPTADVFTSLYEPQNTVDLGDRIVQTTFLQKIPGATRYFRLLAPFYYPAFRSLDLKNYDLIISSSSSFAKAVKKRSDALHICFCHNVTRFLWDTQTYLQEYKDYKAFSFLIRKVFYYLRQTDFTYAKEPDFYIANSKTVADRINEFYGKEAIVINYPIDDGKFIFSAQKEDFYLVSSRLLGYKRIDIIIDAFNVLGLPLVVIGTGPEQDYLKSKSLENIKLLGYVNDECRADLMSRARAVIVAALEDYGLVPIEANVSGTPVIAYGAGGVLDTQIHGQTGLLFKQQTSQALIEAILEEQNMQWNYDAIRKHALSNFSEKVFFTKVKQVIQDLCGRPVQDLLELKNPEQVNFKTSSV
jgi:glycosyltransferase involved in cell wall biosynthesis